MNPDPVKHAQPSLPTTLNLENFWQASGLFPSRELCAKEDHGEWDDKCFRRCQAARVDGKKVAPLDWLWTHPDVRTELFYCTYYEHR